MKHFFIGDLHLGHANVIKYDHRPYETVEEMDKDLIKRWNSVVTDDDIVWFLGDLALTTNQEKLRNYISQLKGKKRLIMGNHDKCKPIFYLNNGFEEVHKRPIIIKNYFVLSHEPMDYMGDGSPFFYIFAHVHNAEVYQTKTKKTQCVSACRQDYYPIEIPEFNHYIEEQEKDREERK